MGAARLKKICEWRKLRDWRKLSLWAARKGDPCRFSCKTRADWIENCAWRGSKIRAWRVWSPHESDMHVQSEIVLMKLSKDQLEKTTRRSHGRTTMISRSEKTTTIRRWGRCRSIDEDNYWSSKAFPITIKSKKTQKNDWSSRYKPEPYNIMVLIPSWKEEYMEFTWFSNAHVHVRWDLLCYW